METIYYLIQGTLPVAIPLLLVALGGMFSERSGVINIGLEGIMMFSSLFGVLFAYWTNSWLVGVIGALVVGAIFGLIIGVFALKLKTNTIYL